jgi:protein involved in polysaccharide export with SLBB domain
VTLCIRAGGRFNRAKVYLFRTIYSFLLIVSASLAIAAQSPASRDRVHLGDIIDVDVVGGFEFDWRGKLTPEGFLVLNGFSETIMALCRTEDEIANDVKRVYSSMLRDPNITVRIIDRTNRPLARIDGAIKTPARVRILRPIHLRELIVRSGGLTDAASGEIVVFRPAGQGCQEPADPSSESGEQSPPKDNGSLTLNIKISDLLNGSAAADPVILSGDVITVTRSEPFYVIGAVNDPRPIYSHIEMTVSRAIASAGGPAKDADLSKVTIFRREAGGTKIINVDLEKIKRDEASDEVLMQFDIIEVTSKGGGKRKYPPVIVSDENEDRDRSELPLRVID